MLRARNLLDGGESLLSHFRVVPQHVDGDAAADPGEVTAISADDERAVGGNLFERVKLFLAFEHACFSVAGLDVGIGRNDAGAAAVLTGGLYRRLKVHAVRVKTAAADGLVCQGRDILAISDTALVEHTYLLILAL